MAVKNEVKEFFWVLMACSKTPTFRRTLLRLPSGRSHFTISYQ